MKPINIQEKFNRFTAQWHPHQIAEVDDMQVLLAKLKDEFVWHTHEHEDELFLVQKGTLEIHFEDRVATIKPGELIVVPKGTPHCPKTKNGEEVWVLLFEKKSTQHTGEVQHEKTQNHYPNI